MDTRATDLPPTPDPNAAAPAQVEVVAPNPIPVIIDRRSEMPTPPTVQSQRNDPSQPARTTFQEDLTVAGQRKVNLIWEYTQAIIALAVVIASVIVASWLAIIGKSNDFPVILTSLVMLVIGFYFSRTNHTAIGGIGGKPTDEYKGR